VTPDRTDAQASVLPTPGDAPDSWIATSLQDEFLSQSIDAIIITDRDLRVRFWNPAAERLYGIPATTAVGKPVGEIVVTLETTGQVIDSLAERAELEASGVWRRRVIHRPRIGLFRSHEVVVDSIVTVLRGADGGPVGALAVNRDVTSSAWLESELAALGSLVVATGRARTKVEVAQAALEILCRATGAEAGIVASADGPYEAAAHVGISEATIEAIVNYGQMGGPLAQALEAPDSFVSADVASAPLREDVRAAVMGDGIEHLIVVGLHLADRLTGFFVLGWRHHSPREPSRPIMHQAAALVAASIENARLLDAVESGLNKERLLTRRMRALVELTRLPETTAAGLSGIERLMADFGAVIEADGSVYGRVEGDELVLGAVDRIDWADAEPFVNRPLASMPMTSSLVAGAPAVLFSLDDWLATADDAAGRSSGFRSVAAFAIRGDDGLEGVIFSMFRRPVDELEIDGRTLESIGRVLDISLANRRLREVVTASERRYRELFEHAPDALLVQSLDEVIIDANPAAERLYGGDIVGHRVAEIVATERVRVDFEDPSARTRSVGIGRRLDGSTFPEEIELRVIEYGGERRVMAIVRDLTERTQMQAELVQAQKMDAIGLLVAGVAHELNNPLASIVGFSHLLRTDPNLPADLRNQADMLVQEANRTRVIVQNLLDFARLRPPERVDIELRPLLDSVLGLQSYVLARNRLTVDLDLAPDLPLLSVDRSQIQQVLINLTVNAAQAIHELDRPGTIRIRAHKSTDKRGPTVRIEVADDGPGVPATIIDRLFMPFVTTKEPGAGTGLGLSVSFGIIASHGGTLRHERNADGGATFVIELPVERGESGLAGSLQPDRSGLSSLIGPDIREPETDGLGPEVAIGPEVAVTPEKAVTVDAESSSDGEVDATEPARPADRPVRVLVLDDEPAIRDFLARVLRRNGHEPILADTGAAALEIVRTSPPDVILCDHRMAGMSGTEFHAAVMAIAPGLAARFAFMSGDVLNPALREFAEDRGVHLLAKPFDIAAVGAMVATLIAAEPV
jgi:PAS domain S-box-containing protein